MNHLRRWQLDPQNPFCTYLAADARLSATDYRDDQTWQLSLGALDAPALALQTRYGGRVGLASLVPMWFLDGRTIYQAQAYAVPPTLTGFAPGYLRAEAKLTPTLTLVAEYWAMESHAVGARFALTNSSSNPITLRLDMFGHVGAEGKELPLEVVPLPTGGHALSLGNPGNLRPAVLVERGNAASVGPPVSPKVGREVTIAGNGQELLRWVHAGLPNLDESVGLANRWLGEDWDIAFGRIHEAARAIPEIHTGDENVDAAIAFSYQQLMQAFLKPTSSLPYASLVGIRAPARGYSVDYDRAWNGQAPPLVYPAALAVAPIQPEWAEGLIRNYLAVQRPDGWIDWKPGLGGQQQGILCLPILARLTWGIFQYSENQQFLKDVFPGLLRFFERWMKPDFDADGDGLPEWQDENQTGYPYMPTFGAWQTWGQGANIRYAESPDLCAYLLSEAKSLREIAYFLRDNEAESKLSAAIEKLEAALESLWNGERYTYRDRDTHLTTGSVTIVENAHGGDELLPALPLTPPNRVIVRITGGVNLVPRLTLKLDGLNAQGESTSESAYGEQFVWSRGRGVYTSQQTFAQLDRITLDGLSRVYRVDAYTVDTTRVDISALLPLWSVGLAPERTGEVIDLLSKSFMRPNGVTMVSAEDPTFDPSNANGPGGVWPFWLTLMGEGLVETGHPDIAYDIFSRLLPVQVDVLKTRKAFSEFYHSDEAAGLGEEGHLGGIVPLYLLLRLLGVRIISGRKVWVGGAFPWEQSVTIRQHGVTVRRAADGTHIEFASGHTIDAAGADWQEFTDPTA
jgi:hypothetical protein